MIEMLISVTVTAKVGEEGRKPSRKHIRQTPWQKRMKRFEKWVSSKNIIAFLRVPVINTNAVWQKNHCYFCPDGTGRWEGNAGTSASLSGCSGWSWPSSSWTPASSPRSIIISLRGWMTSRWETSLSLHHLIMIAKMGYFPRQMGIKHFSCRGNITACKAILSSSVSALHFSYISNWTLSIIFSDEFVICAGDERRREARTIWF